MPTTQKSPQKQTKATQKVGGSAKKPVTKAIEGGSAKKPVTKAMEGGKVAPSKGKTTRGGSAKGGGFKIYQETKERSEDNRKLIRLLYRLITSLVDELNNDKLYHRKNDMHNVLKPYEFKVFKYQKPGNTLGPDIHKPNSLERLISELDDNKEFIRSIEKIYIGRTTPPNYVKKSPDKYLRNDYTLDEEDMAIAEFLEADIDNLRTDSQYRKHILYDYYLPPSNLK